MIKGHPHSSGFTLLEVLIALVIFSFGFVTLMELFSVELQSVTRAKDVSRAVLIARAQMESSLLDPNPSPGETAGATEDGYRWTRVVEKASFLNQDEETEDSPKIYRIKVEVAPSKERRAPFELETLKVITPDEFE